ncbi:MAG: NAD(P)/FAD-dependent oxidoreductase [Herminiimonas sp.]|nr:NAD(P)/FAD-dependent oxidoreductase [Herminiimonas sp.]
MNRTLGQIPPMSGNDQYDVIIIGAGIGGVVSLRYARAAGLRAMVLEKAAGVGGLWRDLPAWQDIQIARADWTLAGIPLHGETQPHILANIKAWGERFNLANDIRLNCEVTSAAQNAGGWTVRAGGKVWRAPHLIDATGAHNSPNIPDVEGQTPRLPEYHSSQLHDPSALTAKDVVVVGGGASAIDLLELCIERGARKVHWVYRSVRWMQPSRRAKYDTAGLRLLARRQALGATPGQMNAALDPFLRGRYKKYGMDEIVPDHAIDLGQEQLIPGRPRMVTDFSRITRHCSTVSRIENRTVQLSDGATIDADLLPLGYRIPHRPELSEFGEASRRPKHSLAAKTL